MDRRWKLMDRRWKLIQQFFQNKKRVFFSEYASSAQEFKNHLVKQCIERKHHV